MVDRNMENNIDVCKCEYYVQEGGVVSNKGDCYATVSLTKKGKFDACTDRPNCIFKRNARKQQALLRIENLIGCIKETYYETDLDENDESSLIDYCDEILDIIGKVKDGEQ